MNLKELRIKKGLTQKNIAEKLNITANAVNQYENQKRQMTAETIVKIVEILDCSADELLGINKKQK